MSRQPPDGGDYIVLAIDQYVVEGFQRFVAGSAVCSLGKGLVEEGLYWASNVRGGGLTPLVY